MDVLPTLMVFLGATTSAPLVYFLNTTAAMGNQSWVFVAGVIVLSTVAFVYYHLIKMISHPFDHTSQHKHAKDPLMFSK